MKNPYYSAAALLTGFALASSAQAAVSLVGVYDPTGDDNDVDQNGAFASGTGVASAANVLTVEGFTTSVATAFAAGTGGVVSFLAGDTEDEEVGGVAGTLTTTPFGGSTLTFAAVTGTSTNIGFGSGSGDRIATSGGAADGGRLGQSGNSDFNFTNFTISNGAPGLGVTEFGVTLIHRNQNAHTWEGSATFSDGSSLSFEPVVFPSSEDAGSTSNSLDTFFGVVAPAGETITGVLLDRTSEGSGANTWVDDIGFVTSVVPEPSSSALLGLGVLALAGRRKRA